MNREEIKKIKMTKDYQFNELDNWAVIPKDTIFEVAYWQGINGQLCPIVDGKPFVDSEIYFKDGEWKPTE